MSHKEFAELICVPSGTKVALPLHAGSGLRNLLRHVCAAPSSTTKRLVTLMCCMHSYKACAHLIHASTLALCCPGASAATSNAHPLAWLAPRTPPGAAPGTWYRVAEPRRAFAARLLARLLAAGPDALDAAALPAVCGALMRVEAAPVPPDGADEVILS